MSEHWRPTPHPGSIGYFPTGQRIDSPPLRCDICEQVVEKPMSRTQKRHQAGDCERIAADRAVKRKTEATRKRARARKAAKKGKVTA